MFRIALGMWDDVIAANVLAQRSSRPGVRPVYGHAAQFLAYALLQERRYREASARIDSVRTQTARLAESKERVLAEEESREYLTLDRAAYVTEARAWRSPYAALEIDTTALELSDLAANDLTLGLSALGRGERARADTIVARLESRNDAARADSGGRSFSALGYADVMRSMLHAALLHSDGKGEAAAQELTAAAARDDSLPFAFGPPVEIESPHEQAAKNFGRADPGPSHAIADLRARLDGRVPSTSQ